MGRFHATKTILLRLSKGSELFSQVQTLKTTDATGDLTPGIAAPAVGEKALQRCAAADARRIVERALGWAVGLAYGTKKKKFDAMLQSMTGFQVTKGDRRIMHVKSLFFLTKIGRAR